MLTDDNLKARREIGRKRGSFGGNHKVDPPHLRGRVEKRRAESKDRAAREMAKIVGPEAVRRALKEK